MGTDIHPIIQVCNGDKWETLNVNAPCNRNYSLFAVLANVRNGYGFAGVSTGDRVEPISEPRGLPSGLTLDDDGYAFAGEKHFNLGDHSYSHLLLSEMKSYMDKNLNNVTTKTGLISLKEYVDNIRGKPENTVPFSWCGSAGGPNVIVHEDPNELEMLLNCGMPIVNMQHHYVRYNWQVNAIEWSGLPDLVKDLEKVTTGYKPEDVRFVFGFDS